MTKNTDTTQEKTYTEEPKGKIDANVERQVWQLESLKRIFPKTIYIFEDKEEFFETWATEYYGSHFYNLFHIDSAELKYVTRPTLKLVPQFWGASAETLEEMVDSGYLGEAYRVVDESSEDHEYINIPVQYENVCRDEAIAIQRLIQVMVNLSVTEGIRLLVLKENNKLLLVFTSEFLNDNFILKNAYEGKKIVAEDYVQTLKEIEELKRMKKLYEEWLELKS